MTPPVEWKLLSVADLGDVRATYEAEARDLGNSPSVRAYCASVARLARREHLRRRYPNSELRKRGFYCHQELVPGPLETRMGGPGVRCYRVRDANDLCMVDARARYQRPIDAWDDARDSIERRDIAASRVRAQQLAAQQLMQRERG